VPKWSNLYHDPAFQAAKEIMVAAAQAGNVSIVPDERAAERGRTIAEHMIGIVRRLQEEAESYGEDQ